jgi:hypothetical protein
VNQPSPFAWKLAWSATFLFASLATTLRAAETVGADRVRALRVEASAVIDSEVAIGALRLVAAFELTSDDPDFGGYSGMELAPDAQRLIAVSDRGSWLSLPLTHDEAGRLTGIGMGTLGPLLNTDGQPTEGRMENDAEELVDLGDSWLVAFEGQHRLWQYHGEDGVHGMAGVTGVAKPFLHPRALRHAEKNGGMEAVAQLANGRLLIISESFLDRKKHLRGWIGGFGSRWQRVSLEKTGDFEPTSLAPLPGGDLLLLERSYSPARGVHIRLSRLRADTLEPGAHLVAEELARMDSRHPSDNFEASASRTGSNGETLIYLLSDDNFSQNQRTLLLQLVLDDP